MTTILNDAMHSIPTNSLSRNNSWIERWTMPMLEVPQRQREVLSDTSSAITLGFQAKALAFSSVAFGVTSTLFSHSLIGNTLLASLLIGGVSGVALFAIDRQTLIDLRQDPNGGRGKALTVRIATIAMALMMSLLGGVESHKDHIARLQSSKTNCEGTLIMKSSEFFPRVKATEAELARELGGALNLSNGQSRLAGRGPKAIHWDAERGASTRKTLALQAELHSLGDPGQRQAKAQSTLKTIADEATSKAAIQQQSAAKKLEFHFQLLREEWTAWLSLGYGC
jgi:hypothetical protein